MNITPVTALRRQRPEVRILYGPPYLHDNFAPLAYLVSVTRNGNLKIWTHGERIVKG